MSKTVLLLGKGELAVRIADWFCANPDYDVQQVVPVVPEPDWTESLIEWCIAHQIPYVQSGHYEDIPGVQNEAWCVDLALSVFYDKIISPWFIDKAGLILNLHTGPLPKYRGVSPINWALKNNETTHGVTLHQISPGVDKGPIVSQVRFSIYPEFDEVVDVYHRAYEYGYTLFEQTMPILERIEPTPQNETEATCYYKKDIPRLGDRRRFTKSESARKTKNGSNS